MSRNWCCQQFESHAVEVPAEDGFRVVLVWRKNYFLAVLEFRMPNKSSLDSSDGGTKIQFCPWCGKNLGQQYAPASG